MKGKATILCLGRDVLAWSQQWWDEIDHHKVSKEVKPHGMRVGMLRSLHSPCEESVSEYGNIWIVFHYEKQL